MLKCFKLPKSQNCNNIDKFLPSLKVGRVIKVYDGDTITVVSKVRRFGKPFKFSIRLNRIDTPELRSKNETEKECAIKIRDILSKKIFNKIVNIDLIKTDKYGRYLCEVTSKSIGNISDWLLENKYAVRYDGGKKVDFNKDNFSI